MGLSAIEERLGIEQKGQNLMPEMSNATECQWGMLRTNPHKYLKKKHLFSSCFIIIIRYLFF